MGSRLSSLLEVEDETITEDELYHVTIECIDNFNTSGNRRKYTIIHASYTGIRLSVCPCPVRDTGI